MNTFLDWAIDGSWKRTSLFYLLTCAIILALLLPIPLVAGSATWWGSYLGSSVGVFIIWMIGTARFYFDDRKIRSLIHKRTSVRPPSEG